MSWRQYSFGPADAGVAIATSASANNAEAGATVNFKSCFMCFFLCVGFDPRHRHVMSRMPAPSAAKNSKGILFRASSEIEMHRAAPY
jgi:hypothetical protein